MTGDRILENVTQVRDYLNGLGYKVTHYRIAARDHRPLLRIVLALGRELSRALVVDAARVLGLSIMSEQDRHDAAYGRACRMEREAKKAKKRLEERM